MEALHAHANARAGLRYVTGRSPLEDGGLPPAPPAPSTPQALAPAGDEASAANAGRERGTP